MGLAKLNIYEVLDVTDMAGVIYERVFWGYNSAFVVVFLKIICDLT